MVPRRPAPLVAASTRRLLKRLNEEAGLPIVVFTDGDPWSYRIFVTDTYLPEKLTEMGILN